MPISKTVRIVALLAIAVAAVACVSSVQAIPPDQKLGTMVRFVMFHGASTWVNMGTFTLAGIFGLAYLLGIRGAGRWGEAFRWLALPHWVINSVLGVLSMKLIWGGILWNEPRLIMTFGLLAGAIIILAVQLIFDHPRIPAALDAVLAVALWYLVLALPNLFHPNSPVFNSANQIYIYAFLGMVASMMVMAVAAAVLVTGRKHAEHPHGHALT